MSWLKTIAFTVLFLLCIHPVMLARNNGLDKDNWNKIVEEKNYNDNRKLDKDEWEKIRKDKNYKEDYIEEEPEPEAAKEEEPVNIPSWDGNIPQSLIYAFIIIIIVILLVYIIIQYKHNPSIENKKIEVNNLEEAEENLPESDLEKLLKKALAEQNYQLAIRVQFLMAIQNLAHLNIIQWKKDKTNWSYYNECPSEIKTHFQPLIVAFEKFWYGEREANSSSFEDFRNQYQHLNSAIPKSE